jgi:hypothetical protein
MAFLLFYFHTAVMPRACAAARLCANQRETPVPPACAPPPSDRQYGASRARFRHRRANSGANANNHRDKLKQNVSIRTLE